MDVAVIGAGPAGLAAAMRLSQRGASVVVYETAQEVGGLARSLELWDRRVDLGSHVIADDVPGVTDLLEELVGDRVHRVPLRRGIVLDGRCYGYPFSPVNVARTAGVRATLRLLGSFAFRDAHRGQFERDQSAEAWVTERFGRAFHDSFFRPYAEKLWGMPSSRIDASFARDLVGAPAEPGAGGSPLPRRIWDRLHPAPSRHGRSESFAYPSDGLGALSDAMHTAARRAGAEFRTSTKVDGLDIRDGRVVGLEAGSIVHPLDAVVAAVPLPVASRLVATPDDVAGLVDAMRTRSTVLAYLAVDDTAAFSELWRYLCDPDLLVGRVANLARWQSPTTRPSCFPRTLLCCEIWCDVGDSTWRASDSDIATSAIHDLAAVGLVVSSAVAATHVVRLPGTHAVPDLGAERAVERVRAYLGSIDGLHMVGRAKGSQDVGTALQSGLLAASAVLRKTAVPNLRMDQ